VSGSTRVPADHDVTRLESGPDARDPRRAPRRPTERASTAWRVGAVTVGAGLLVIGRDGWRPLLDAGVPLRTGPFLVTLLAVVLLASAVPASVGGALVARYRRLDRRGRTATLVVLYTVSWGATLLSAGGRFWDDWTLVGVPREETIRGFTELGLPWIGHLHVALLTAGPWLYRVLTLVLFLVIGLAVQAIVERVPWLSAGERWFLVLLVLVLPLNSARHALIDMPYTISLALFCLAWYLLVRERELSTGTAAFATALLVVSYTTQSLLVFVVVPLAHLLVREVPPSIWSAGTLTRWALRRWYLLASPVAFYAVKTTAFPAHGEYAGYNTIQPAAIATAVGYVALTVVAFALVAVTAPRLPRPAARSAPLLLGGAVLVAVAVMPYLAAGHVPRFYEWNSRHQLLVPFGAALFGVGTVRLVRELTGVATAALVAAALAASCILFSLHLSVSFAVDWGKQREVIAALAASDEVRDHETFVYRDRVLGQNANGRTWRPYEVNGFLAEATGDETRGAVKPAGLAALPTHEQGALRYRASQYEFDRDAPVIVIDIVGDRAPMLLQLFDRPPVHIRAVTSSFDDLTG
jgi:hypothetical protein